MRILLLGATGRLGKFILDELLSQGYDVNALVRKKEAVKIRNSKLNLIEGSPLDVEKLQESLSGCSVLLSSLNISRATDFPWSKLRTPDHFLSDTMKNIISLGSGKLDRVIVCSAWGVSETKKDLPGWFRWFIDNSNIGVAYRDHERQEELIMASDIKFTIVRPVGLTNSRKLKPVIISYNNRPKAKLVIARISVARFMVDAINDDRLINKAPVVSS